MPLRGSGIGFLFWYGHENVTVTYPQASRVKRSLRTELVSYAAALGGKLERSSEGIAVRALENVSLSLG
jgi:hypothetical protein